MAFCTACGVRIDDADGFQVLSMLKLDEETRGIPVLTYTTEYEGQDFDEAISINSGFALALLNRGETLEAIAQRLEPSVLRVHVRC